jgi:DNA-binding LacI/PurR family transcriptional regulator
VVSQPLARPRVTIKDVARACGLAPSTVSNALSGSGYVAEGTRAQVLDMARRLDYRASSVARGLRLQRSWSVGLLLADIANPWFPELVRGVEDVLWSAGINLVLCNTDYQDEKEDAYLRHLVDKQVDGLILASTGAQSAAVARLQAEGVPLVMLSRRHASVATDYVGMDNAGGTAAAVGHLVGLGHRRIAFIAGRIGSSAAAERKEGFRQAMLAHLGAAPPALIEQGDYSIASGSAAARRLLARDPPPTAIVSANDFMAYGAIEVATRAGLSVPGDLSVTGFDDILVSALSLIGLTTIRPPTWRLGAAAAELLLKRVGKKAGGPRDSIILPSELVIRATTGPCSPAAQPR